MLRDNIVKLLTIFYYPQNVFAKYILKYVNISASSQTLIDAPSGNGETAWFFSKYKKLNVLAYDISEKSIQHSKKNYIAYNLSFQVADIHSVSQQSKVADYFCIINSLFLLPQPEVLLKTLSKELKQDALLCVIIPNTEGENFKWFTKHNGNVNKLILKHNEIKDYFKTYGFNAFAIKPIAYTHNYGRKDVKLFSALACVYLSFLNFFQTTFKIGKPNYYLIIASKL